MVSTDRQQLRLQRAQASNCSDEKVQQASFDGVKVQEHTYIDLDSC